jgi:predicted RNA-binding Zn ribbon-like protein
VGGFDHAAFRVDGRALCLDLTATLSGRRSEQAVEHLREPNDLSRWLIATGMLAGEVRVSQAQLDRARELREAIRSLANDTIAGESFDDRALEFVNRMARPPRLVPQLTVDGLTHAAPARSGLVDAGLSSIAADAVELLGGRDRARLKECASPTCALLFIDRSRAGRRRWCSMETCGNRAKTRHYRKRVKERASDSRVARPQG